MTAMPMNVALRSAMDVMLERDDDVVVFGEDVGYFGGVFRCTDGLQARYGEHRVFDTPIAEGGIIGVAVGMGAYGLRPVAEIQFGDYVYPGLDQLISEAARLRYRSSGEFNAPITVRMPVGGGIHGGQTHSQSPEALFTHVCGLKTVVPSNPYDAKGLLLSCLRQEDPVLFMEPKRIYRAARGEVPTDDYTVPLGVAKIAREGEQCTLVAYGAMVPVVEEAADKAAAQNISCEVIDLRTLMPFDVEALVATARKTGRVVIVHEAPRTAGFGGELASTIYERAIEYMEAPIQRVCGFDTPFPYSLEHEYMPNADRVLSAIRATLEW